jgi:MerR family transcriptional regulator, copper efflux regulator
MNDLSHSTFFVSKQLDGDRNYPHLLTQSLSKGDTVNMTELLAAIRDDRVTARFVRFLIAEGVIPAPQGGRANANYGEDHVRGIDRYLRLRDHGLSASRTKQIVAGSALSEISVPIASGLTLLVDPNKFANSTGATEIAAKIAEALQLINPNDD